ncbi:MAG: polysaccharide biosynthesis/export family protein [Desulfatirhabdiaceae bacterium]
MISCFCNPSLRVKMCSLFSVLVLWGVMGCANGVRAPSPALSEMKPDMSSGLRFKTGDTVEIKFAYASQFNETQYIRPDGKIELPLIGEIVARGKTPAELRDELIKLYTPQLKHPDLAVMIRSSFERRIYVGGEVNEPGLIEMPGDITLLEAIMHAGGFNLETAEVQNIVVARLTEGKQRGYGFDLTDALAGMEVEPFHLQPRDIVYVPRTTIADVNQWIQQHIYDILPNVSVGLGFSYHLNDYDDNNN